jgi:hypothetical protein
LEGVGHLLRAGMRPRRSTMRWRRSPEVGADGGRSRQPMRGDAHGARGVRGGRSDQVDACAASRPRGRGRWCAHRPVANPAALSVLRLLPCTPADRSTRSVDGLVVARCRSEAARHSLQVAVSSLRR